jgi:hypothetical protein
MEGIVFVLIIVAFLLLPLTLCGLKQVLFSLCFVLVQLLRYVWRLCGAIRYALFYDHRNEV